MDHSSPPAFDQWRMCEGGHLELADWLRSLAQGFHHNWYLKETANSRGIAFHLNWASTMLAMSVNVQDCYLADNKRLKRRIARLEAQARTAGLPDLVEIE